MKIETIDTSNNALALLFFLNIEEYISSSAIREEFKNLNENTLRSWLKDFVKAGILDKLELMPDTAGGDKAMYKLTPAGIKKRDELIEKFIKTFSQRIEQLIEERVGKSEKSIEVEDKSERINNFIMEFSEYFMGTVDNAVLTEIQERLQQMLDDYF